MNPTQPPGPPPPRPPAGSLQEWVLRSSTARSSHGQQPNEVSAPPPAPADPPDAADATDVPQRESATKPPSESAIKPAIEPAGEPAPQPIPVSPAAPAFSVALEQPGVTSAPPASAAKPPTVRAGVSATMRQLRSRKRPRWIALVAVIAAVLALGVSGRQLSQTGGGGGEAAPPPALFVTGSEPEKPATPMVTKLTKPAAFKELATLDGWQVKIIAMYDCPVLMAISRLTTAAFPRILRMSVTLVNSTDRPQAATAWVLSATVNGAPVTMITYPGTEYIGVPQKTIAPGRSVVFPVAVPLPRGRTDLAIEAVHDQAGLAMSFIGKG